MEKKEEINVEEEVKESEILDLGGVEEDIEGFEETETKEVEENAGN